MFSVPRYLLDLYDRLNVHFYALRLHFKSYAEVGENTNQVGADMLLYDIYNCAVT